MSIINNELLFYDCNAFIGNHQNPYVDSPFELNMLEDTIKASGLNGSLVYHSASVLYDASYGNKKLIEETKNKSGLHLIWIAIPELCNPEKEAELFFSQIIENKISAIKIFPRYHNYNVSTGAIDKLLSFLDEEKIPLLVNQEEISWDEITYILAKYKNVPFLLQSTGYRMERYIISFFEKYKNFYLDISRYQAHGGIEYLCRQFGSEHIFFGSGMPVFSPEPIMMMIDNAKISLEEKQNISSKNLLRLIDRG
ncbi:MAG: amidohydrolase family protein [Bacteroidetes bacterium]|nr:amidohydrolase family protein [Bacteroidota bacterium]